MTEEERRLYLSTLRVARCCRDWPVTPLARIGRCGDCGERPEMTDKTIDQYMAERGQA